MHYQKNVLSGKGTSARKLNPQMCFLIHNVRIYFMAKSCSVLENFFLILSSISSRLHREEYLAHKKEDIFETSPTNTLSQAQYFLEIPSMI